MQNQGSEGKNATTNPGTKVERKLFEKRAQTTSIKHAQGGGGVWGEFTVHRSKICRKDTVQPFESLNITGCGIVEIKFFSLFKCASYRLL